MLLNEFLQEHGFFPRDSIYIETGRLTRFDYEKPGDKKGWYIAYQDSEGRFFGKFGIWGTGNASDGDLGIKFSQKGEKSFRWSRGREKTLDRQVESQLRQIQESEQRETEEARYASEQEAASHVFSEALSDLTPLHAGATHEYLSSKGVCLPSGCQAYISKTGALAIPLKKRRKIVGLQEIFFDKGTQKFVKIFKKGTKKRGAGWLIGDISRHTEVAYICEGVATAISVHEISGGAPVVACFDAGNIFDTYAVLAEAVGGSVQIVIAADNDGSKSLDNPGLASAYRAGEGTALVKVPPCPIGESADWNDLHQKYGTARAKKLFANTQNMSSAQAKFFPPAHYRIKAEGIFCISDKDDEPAESPVCTPLRILSLGEDGSGTGHGAVVRYENASGIRIGILPNKNLYASGERSASAWLGDRGGVVYNEKSFVNLLKLWQPACPPVHFLTGSGWQGAKRSSFFLSSFGIIGLSQRQYLEISTSPIGISQRGSVREWREHVASEITQSPACLLALCVAASSPLMKILGLSVGAGFIVHLYGTSSIGKTTAAHVARSLWGGEDFLKNWYTTFTAIEDVAVRCSEVALVLDEIKQADPRSIGAIAYMISNGVNKGRGKTDGTSRERRSWLLCALSNGEKSLQGTIEAHHGHITGGQAVRVIDWRIDSAGIFPGLPTEESRNLVNSLKTACNNFFGSAGVHYIEHLTVDNNREYASEIYQIANEKITAIADSREWNYQARRIGSSFALLVTAGDMLVDCGLIDIEKSALERILLDILAEVIDQIFGGSGHDVEKISLLQRLDEFLTMDKPRFATLGSDGLSQISGVRGSEVWAYAQYDTYGRNLDIFIPPKIFKNKIAGDLAESAAAKHLYDEGLLEKEGSGTRTTYMVRKTIDGVRGKFYKIHRTVEKSEAAE